MDCEAERILQISLRKLTEVRQQQCLGSSLRQNLLVSSQTSKVSLFHFDEYDMWVPPVTVIFLTYATSSIRTVWAAATRQYFCLH